MVDTLRNRTPQQLCAEGLDEISFSEASARVGWLKYGRGLNEWKNQYPGKENDRAFGEAVKAAGLNRRRGKWMSAKLTDIHDKVRSAAMWAASLDPTDLAALEEAHQNTRVTSDGGFRGLHAAVKEAEKRAHRERELAEIGERGRTALKNIVRGYETIWAGWISVGTALNEMLADHGDDKEAFVAAVEKSSLAAMATKSSPYDGAEALHPSLAAAMWAAALPLEELLAIKDKFPTVDIPASWGFRDLHAVVQGLIDPAEFADGGRQVYALEALNSIADLVSVALSGADGGASELDTQIFDEEGIAEISVHLGGRQYRVSIIDAIEYDGEELS